MAIFIFNLPFIIHIGLHLAESLEEFYTHTHIKKSKTTKWINVIKEAEANGKALLCGCFYLIYINTFDKFNSCVFESITKLIKFPNDRQKKIQL